MPDTRDTPRAADRSADNRRRRAEMIDVLSEALWSLLCAGRGPGQCHEPAAQPREIPNDRAGA